MSWKKWILAVFLAVLITILYCFANETQPEEYKKYQSIINGFLVAGGICISLISMWYSKAAKEAISDYKDKQELINVDNRIKELLDLMVDGSAKSKSKDNFNNLIDKFLNESNKTENLFKTNKKEEFKKKYAEIRKFKETTSSIEVNSSNNSTTISNEFESYKNEILDKLRDLQKFIDAYIREKFN